MYISFNKIDKLVSAIAKMPLRGNEQVLILLAECHAKEINKLVSKLNEHNIGFFGSIFPGLIYGDKTYKKGAIVKVFPLLDEPYLAHLDNGRLEWDKEPQILRTGRQNSSSVCVFVDCLAPNISGFLANLFNKFGNNVNYFGAGAGNSGLMKEPAVFTSAGSFSDAAVVALLDQEVEVNVRHGWTPLKGPYIATRTDKNVIKELDWDVAEKVYRESLADELNIIRPERFFPDVTKHYPFSIHREGGEDVVRDPIGMTDKGGLVCVSDVPENSVMYIMHGDPGTLIEAATLAVDECKGSEDRQANSCLVSDCYSRALLLGNDFNKELSAVAEKVSLKTGGIILEGVLALGEIAGDGERPLEFYNKTFVISIFYG